MAASKGLGRSSAISLVREGAQVTICARSKDGLEETAQLACRSAGCEESSQSKAQPPVHVVVADITRPTDLERVVDETIQTFGGIDILVTNAGGPPAGPFMEITDEQWLNAIDLNVMSVVRMCRLVVPHMRQRGGGRIIHITTVGVLKTQPNMVLSDATRRLVAGIAKVMALELAQDNILVNTVGPGPIRTDRMTEVIERFAELKNGSLQEAEELWLNQVPLRCMGEPDDVGDLVAFLASDPAKFLTGTVIPIDGGKSIS